MKDNKAKRIQIKLSREEEELALALSQSRTCLHWSDKHFCRHHNRIVDKNHINDCDQLRGAFEVTSFNVEIKTSQIYTWPADRIIQLKAHLAHLNTKIQQLEKTGIYVQIKREINQVP